MIVFHPEMNELIIKSNREIKPFDLKLINDIKRNHPFQKIMTWVFKFYNFYNDELEDDILYEIDYFKLLDRYYR